MDGWSKNSDRQVGADGQLRAAPVSKGTGWWSEPDGRATPPPARSEAIVLVYLDVEIEDVFESCKLTMEKFQI